MPAKKISEEAVEAAVEMLARRWLKGAIKRALATQYKITSARTAERVLARAREEIRNRAKLGVDELLQQAIGFYDAVIRSSKTDIQWKLKAQERLDKLLGLEARETQDSLADKTIRIRRVDRGPKKIESGADTQ